VWFETAGRRLTEAQLRDLVLQGRTRLSKWTYGDRPAVAGRLVLAPKSGGARLEPA
jgi:hypothetical protein